MLAASSANLGSLSDAAAFKAKLLHLGEDMNAHLGNLIRTTCVTIITPERFRKASLIFRYNKFMKHDPNISHKCDVLFTKTDENS